MSQKPTHQPGPTLISEWIRLLTECSFQYHARNYLGAYRYLLDLQSSLPKEAYDITKKDFDKINDYLNKIDRQAFYDKVTENNVKKKQASHFLSDKVLPLKRLIHSALEETGWISKESGYSGLDANQELESL